MRARHGLIVGKFYPPHPGHHFLIDTAAAICDEVTVVVAGADVETIPIALRAGWLREGHAHQVGVHVVGCVDNHPIDYADPGVWDLHMEVFQNAIQRSPVQSAVDAVFTPEPYGAELARRLGARWAGPGLGREPNELSASQVRSDPPAHWEQLSAPVRAWFAKRVVVVGAESTGTTTLTRLLCDEYRRRGGPYGLTQWVPEYGRELSWRKLAVLTAERALADRSPPSMSDLVWSDVDFMDVVATQNAWEDTAAANGGPLLLCDTDSWATRLWQKRYLGHVSPDVVAASEGRNRDLYVLTHHAGVPFVQDGVRDGAEIREAMTAQFQGALAEQHAPYIVVDSGDIDARLRQVIDAIDTMLSRGWNLGTPLEYQGD